MPTRLTQESQAILDLAATLAAKAYSDVQPGHLLVALSLDQRAALTSILRHHGCVFGNGNDGAGELRPVHSVPELSDRAKAIVEAAFQTAIRRGEMIASPSHIALALLRSNDPQVEELLATQQVDVASLVRDILIDLGGSDIVVEMFGEQYDPIKWSQEGRRIVRGAQYESAVFRNDYVGSEHILLSLLRDSINPAAQFLERFYPIPITIAGVPSAVKAVAGGGGQTLVSWLRFTINGKRLLANCQLQARRMGRSFVGSEHILFSVLDNPDSTAARALSKRVNLGRLEKDLEKAFGAR